MRRNTAHDWVFPLLLVLTILGLPRPRPAGAVGEAPYISSRFTPGSFPLVANGVAAAIYVDTNDLWGVVRAAGDLQADVRRVT